MLSLTKAFTYKYLKLLIGVISLTFLGRNELFFDVFNILSSLGKHLLMVPSFLVFRATFELYIFVQLSLLLDFCVRSHILFPSATYIYEVKLFTFQNFVQKPPRQQFNLS